MAQERTRPQDERDKVRGTGKDQGQMAKDYVQPGRTLEEADTSKDEKVEGDEGEGRRIDEPPSKKDAIEQPERRVIDLPEHAGKGQQQRGESTEQKERRAA